MTLCRLMVLVLMVLSFCIGDALASDGQRDPASIPGQSPYTYLLDTGTASATALSEEQLAQRAGWTIVPEDDSKHRFKGDTVFLNDRVVVVLRRDGPGAEVYSRTRTGFRRRALLVACAGEAEPITGLSSARIVENNPAAVMLEVLFQTKESKGVSATYRLTTGQAYLEFSPGRNADILLIRLAAQYVVVPDFFGDDLVYGAGVFRTSHIALPIESYFLSMIEASDAIVMCVCESDSQDTRVILSGERGRQIISGCEIRCQKDKRIWIAFMEGPGIWHERAILAKDGGRDIELDWQPPFPAKWRADFVHKEELSQSCDFRYEEEPGLISSATDPPVCSCWFEGSRPNVRVPKFQTIEKGNNAVASCAGPVLIYPIDRNQATPLNLFCPVDILRNTLGMGPCQYMLEKEGFGLQSHPTPDQVTQWVENLFQKKRQKQASAQIEDRLSQMVEHIRQIQMRIKQYGDFARQISSISQREKPDKAPSEALGKLLDMARDMEQDVIRSNAMTPAESAARLAKEIVALIGQDDALARCRKLGTQIRTLGAAQNKVLSKCRTAVRRIRQQCINIAGEEPQAAVFAGNVQKLAEQILRHK